MADTDTSPQLAELIVRIAMRLRQDMTTSFTRAFAEVDLGGLTPHQARMVGFIEANEAGGLTQRDLAEATGTRAATISSLLTGLERDGWVERRPDPHDARRKTVHVTDKARRVVKSFESAIWATSSVDLSAFTAGEQTQLVELLTRLDRQLAG
ncbi:MarR family winged helix-turn-helix transcriptional regulator [Cellulomonas citrea]|uniref:MarR family winged helix-turn-helix transcriptional regulator n=1 Tax=Cellulomonas citrea TaxID=1909423 RepID=UPI00135AADCA|nr:MarR family transcriptional regulator [Cellulomonas citrea]